MEINKQDDSSESVIRINFSHEETLVSFSNSFLYVPLDLTLNEARIFFTIASQIKKESDIDSRFRVYLKDLIEVLNYKREKKMSKSIYQRIYSEIKSIEENNLNYNSQVKLLVNPIYQSNEGYFEASIQPLLKPFLADLEPKKSYTKVKLQELLCLKSYYTQRIYLLVKHSLQNEHLSDIIDLKALRFLLSIENKYKDFYDIKRRILEPAQKDISNTGLNFNFIPKKLGNKTVALKIKKQRIHNIV